MLQSWDLGEDPGQTADSRRIQVEDGHECNHREASAAGCKDAGDWEEVKDAVMFRGLHAKYDQHPNLARLLLGTQDSVIVEKSPRDWYWGSRVDRPLSTTPPPGLGVVFNHAQTKVNKW